MRQFGNIYFHFLLSGEHFGNAEMSKQNRENISATPKRQNKTGRTFRQRRNVKTKPGEHFSVAEMSKQQTIIHRLLIIKYFTS
jgi:hypothetical protein